MLLRLSRLVVLRSVRSLRLLCLRPCLLIRRLRVAVMSRALI